jgi:kinesin family protein 2/24
VQPLVREAFSKIKITCFSYGQTGSGKTFTMMGHDSNNQTLEENSGLILLTAHDIFSYLSLDAFSHLEVYISFYEIYCEKVFDLLNERNAVMPLEDKNNTVNLKNLTEQQVWNESDLTRVVKKGLKARTVGVTGANADSSRSHALIEVNIREPEGKNFTKIVFVDLAGTERAVDVIETNKQTRFDTGKINEGLFSLKECIRALRANSTYIPFRKNTLTFVLKDYFCSQKTKMLMITNITPTLGSVEYTLNSLRYAKMLKNDKVDESKFNFLFYFICFVFVFLFCFVF